VVRARIRIPENRTAVAPRPGNVGEIHPADRLAQRAKSLRQDAGEGGGDQESGHAAAKGGEQRWGISSLSNFIAGLRAAAQAHYSNAN
jgi:hypothetical protein